MASSDDDAPLSLLKDRATAALKAEPPPPSSSEDDIPLASVKKNSASSAAKRTPTADKEAAQQRKGKGKASAKKGASGSREAEPDDGSDEDEISGGELAEESDQDFEARKRPVKRARSGGSDNNSEAKPKRKAPAKAKQAAGTKETTANSNGNAAATRETKKTPRAPRDPSKFKDMTRLERIEHALKAYKWWEEATLEDGKLWNHIEHNGVNFSGEYEPHGIKMLYDGKTVGLTAEQEEVASFYATIADDAIVFKTPDVAKVFRKNFFADFRKVLGGDHIIQTFGKCDFSPIKAHLDNQKLVNKSKTGDEKAQAKSVKEVLMFKYGFTIVDGHLERVGNTTIEPPGLFRGRGKHPKAGMLKQRVYPDQVSLNIGELARVPQCPVKGYAWESVQHDPSVSWLANWKENIMGSNKYVQLAANSSFKGQSDMEKYNKAMKLMGYIEKIREDYTKKLKSSDRQTRQIATAVWIIDKLALRVGGEKGEDEADTVGCCSLRLEHLKFIEDDGSAHEIELEFLGKDSMLFKQTIDFDKYGDIGRTVYGNLKFFCKNKRKSEDVFEDLTPTLLNSHLQSLMTGLSAKVFRTFNASFTLQRELPDAAKLDGLTLQEKVVEYNKANREVAILCNHQRTVSSAQIANLETQQAHLDTLKTQRKELKEMRDAIKNKRTREIKLKEGDTALEEEVAAAVKQAKELSEAAKTDAERVAATNAKEEATKLKRGLAKRKFEENHRFTSVPSLDQVEGRIKQWGERIRKKEVDMRDKVDNKEVALNTSKKNYMDPRISVAWCKRHEVPIEKVFPKTLRDQFVWAMHVPPDWEFSFDTLEEMHKSKRGQMPTMTKEMPPAKRAKLEASAFAAAAEKEREASGGGGEAVNGAAKSKKGGREEEEEEEEEADSSPEEESGSSDDE